MHVSMSVCLFVNGDLPQENTSSPSDRKLLLGRANELVNVLKMPSVAAAVLSPAPNSSDPEHVEKQRMVCTLMQATSRLVITTPTR